MWVDAIEKQHKGPVSRCVIIITAPTPTKCVPKRCVFGELQRAVEEDWKWQSQRAQDSEAGPTEVGGSYLAVNILKVIVTLFGFAGVKVKISQIKDRSDETRKKTKSEQVLS